MLKVLPGETKVDKLMTFQINTSRPGKSRVTHYLLPKAYFSPEFMVVCTDAAAPNGPS